jgi:hypothetical protein
MAFGDGIRRNIAHVEPSERTLLRDAILELNNRFFAGSRTDTPPGGVSWWFKQDEVHQATHVHGGAEFIPWHREIANRFEASLRQINPKLSLHYWDWTQDPRAIPDANLGGGTTGSLNLFTTDFMGFGGPTQQPIGEPFLSAGFYDPGAAHFRSADPFDSVNNNPADPPLEVVRSVSGSPASQSDQDDALAQTDYYQMATRIEDIHNAMHGFVNMGNQHTSFRDPFVFLLHSNVDRLFARWQTEPGHSDRLHPAGVYGVLSGTAVLNGEVEPWSGNSEIRPWAAPENQQDPHTYKDATVVAPPCYDTNHANFYILESENPFNAATNRHQVVFNDVPEEETTWRAAVIRVFTCGDVTFTITPGAEPPPPFVLATPSVEVTHGANAIVEARIWFEFTAGAAGTAPQNLGPVDASIRCVETGEDFPLELLANTIERPTVAVQLALDQSGSMAWAAGTSGATRLQVLIEAASLFANLVQKGNGIGIIRFDDNAYPPDHATFGGMAITRVDVGGFGDPTIGIAINRIEAHGAHGNTSVGDGLQMARAQLSDPQIAADYQRKAIVILTDGLENEPEWIDQVGPIDDLTYAVGLGNETQVNTAALTALAGSTGGSLLLSGLLGPDLEDKFRLKKFFLQILAGVTNTSIVSDPAGYLKPGTKVKIPFVLNEADINCRVILIGDAAIVKLSLESPTGELVDEAGAGGTSIEFESTSDLKTARFTLPAVLPSGAAPAGTWHAVLEIDPAFKDSFSTAGKRYDPKGARYCLSVHAYSNLRMAARIDQSAFTPGATLMLRARLSEYGVPVEQRAMVRAELEYPDGAVVTVPLAEIQPGRFEASLVAGLSGIYRFNVKAEGVTFKGAPFTREQLLTAAVSPEIARQPGGGSGPGDLARAFAVCCRRISWLAFFIIFLLLVIIWLLWSR